MTAGQHVEISIEDVLERAKGMGYVVIGLPGVGTVVLPPVGRGDEELVAEIKRRTAEVEAFTLAAMPTREQAEAWDDLRRVQRARSEA